MNHSQTLLGVMLAAPYGHQNVFLMIKTTIQMLKDLKMSINSASVLNAQFAMKKVIQKENDFKNTFLNDLLDF